MTDPADQPDQPAPPTEAPSPQQSPIDQVLRFRRTQERFAQAMMEKLESVDTGLRRWCVTNIKDERPKAPPATPVPKPAPKKPYANRLGARLHKK